MKYIYLCLVLLTLSACTVTQPYIAEYRIITPESQENFSSTECKDKSLKISQLFSQSTLMTQSMKYAQNEYGEFAFSESAWARTPNSAITHEILKSVRESKLFASVQSYKSRSKSDFILESSVEEFLQYFSKDTKSSFVNVVMAFTLVDTKTSKAIDTLSVSKKVEVKSLDAEGGVEALNAALTQVLLEKNRWLNEVCR